ncbi:hypothetical protein JZ751_012909 [Albula glossodonta]|uniref:Uncharacterized protein n=1 Tax=Albula glossodonta TaxID=121402 RepID=A0A8T2MYP5_9TELE|nr:hypothetical protein JZ751_012909 [Albula glossodonta]
MRGFRPQSRSTEHTPPLTNGRMRRKCGTDLLQFHPQPADVSMVQRSISRKGRKMQMEKAHKM